MKKTNKILEDHGDWLIVDISTPKYPGAHMAVDTDVFKRHKGGRIYADNLNQRCKYIYATHNLDGNKFLFHRDVVECGDLQCDHIEHGTMTYVDNRRSNLRAVTSHQNCCNRSMRVDNTSGIKGVYWHKRDMLWHTNIRVNGKLKHLGSFDNLYQAIGVRAQAERDYQGEYAFGGKK